MISTDVEQILEAKFKWVFYKKISKYAAFRWYGYTWMLMITSLMIVISLVTLLGHKRVKIQCTTLLI